MIDQPAECAAALVQRRGGWLFSVEVLPLFETSPHNQQTSAAQGARLCQHLELRSFDVVSAWYWTSQGGAHELSVQVIINTLLASAPQLFHVVQLCFFVYMMFALIGLQVCVALLCACDRHASHLSAVLPRSGTNKCSI